MISGFAATRSRRPGQTVCGDALADGFGRDGETLQRGDGGSGVLDLVLAGQGTTYGRRRPR